MIVFRNLCIFIPIRFTQFVEQKLEPQEPELFASTESEPEPECISDLVPEEWEKSKKSQNQTMLLLTLTVKILYEFFILKTVLNMV